MGWIIGGIAALLLILFATPMGRRAIGRIIGSAGSKADIEAERLQSARTLQNEHRTRVESETREALSQTERAYVGAQVVLEGKNSLKTELSKWQSNLDEALRQVDGLTSDSVPDEKQVEEIGRLKGIGQTAIDKINGIKATLAANAENYRQAEGIIKEAEGLFKDLPERAADKLRQGDVAAATIEIASAQRTVAQGSMAFSDSKADRVLEQMKAKAQAVGARAKAAQARAQTAPASADVTANLLRKSGNGTADFDTLLTQRKAAATPSK